MTEGGSEEMGTGNVPVKISEEYREYTTAVKEAELNIKGTRG